MMSEEQLRESRVSDESRHRSQSRVSKLLSEAPFQNPDLGLGDVRLTVVARDGFRVSMDVHRVVLSEKIRFFAKKLRGISVSHSVEICECDDVDVYVEAVVLMYCDDIKRRLMGEKVSKVLGLLKIAAAWKPVIKKLGMWKSIRSLARLYDAGMGMIIFVPIAFFSWFPFVSTFQTRLMFNQAFSRGLEISLILAGNNPNSGL